MKNFLRGFSHVLYPLRYLVFIALGSIVLSLTNCAPEPTSNNPPQSVESSY